MEKAALEYFKKLKKVERVAICKRAKISHRWLENMMYSNGRPSAKVAQALEDVSGGRVKAKDIRPDLDWELISNP